MELTQAGGSEVQHRGGVAAGVHHMILVLKDQAAAPRLWRAEPLVFIITLHLGAEGLALTLGTETAALRIVSALNTRLRVQASFGPSALSLSDDPWWKLWSCRGPTQAWSR